LENNGNNDMEYEERGQDDMDDIAEPKILSSRATPATSVRIEDSLKYSNKSTLAIIKSQPKDLLIYDFIPILRATYRELKTFIMSPCPPGIIVRCYIERNRSGTNRFAPYYSLCADLEDGTGRELILCKKIFQSRSPHYVFSLKGDDLNRKREYRSKLFVGKLRGIASSEYVLYDDGVLNVGENDGDDEIEYVDDGQDDIDATTNSCRATVSDSSKDNKSSVYQPYVRDPSVVPLCRSELVGIIYNTRTRPTPSSVRGLEICIPDPLNLSHQAVTAQKTSGRSMTGKANANLMNSFRRIQASGKQNDEKTNKYVILHEKNSR
jgi:hypothetical protein